MRKVFGGLALTVALLAPRLVRADDHDRRHVVTYYDSEASDRHEWNEHEQRAYRHWLEHERHARYRDWKHANKADQRAYWQWRHANPNWHE